MEPKFQSSFIPKGLTSAGPAGLSTGPVREKNLLAFLASVIFVLSIFLAGAMFGYKFYLKYRISQMESDLERARAALQPEVIRELTRLNSRIVSAGELVSKHRVLTPLFQFLEISTPKTVRFSDFSYSGAQQGSELSLKGEARSYAALALQADTFNQSRYFKDSLFSDLNLNSKGDVSFSFRAVVEPDSLSYQKLIKSEENEE